MPPVSFSFPAGCGQVLTFSNVTGIINVNFGGDAPPDGFGTDSGPPGFTVGSWNGISGFEAQRYACLVGVFLSDMEPADPAPPPISFATISLAFTNLQPAIGQVFYTGDGRTASGQIQQFLVPTNATRLFLGIPDHVGGTASAGWYDDNSGSVTATFSITNKLVVLRALEVVQVVQDWENSVPLIQDKQTLVRAHLQLLCSNSNPVVVKGARLHGTRGGTALPGSPLSSMSLAGQITVRTNNAAAVRTNLAGSLNFRLPNTWLTGAVELRFEWTNGAVLCAEPAERDGTASNCAVKVSFQPMPVPEVKFVSVSWSTNAASTNRLAAGVIPELKAQMLALYPVARVNIRGGQLYWTNMAPTNVNGLNSQITMMRLADLFFAGADTNAARRLYYGAVPPLPAGYPGVRIGGLVESIPGNIASGYVSVTPLDSARNRQAHELGHALARNHAVNAALFGTTGGSKLGPCGEIAAGTAPEFPIYLSFPTLGPLRVSDDKDVYGYDSHQRVLVNPFLTFDIMSYCFGPMGWRWISKYTYTNLQNAIINRFGAGGAPGPARPAPPQSYLVIRGMIELTVGQTDFLPFYAVDLTEPPPPPEPGAYVLRLLGAGGLPLGDIPFQPLVGEADAIEGVPVPQPTHGLFTIPVPFNPLLRQVIVLRNGMQLGVRTASAQAPLVHVLSPNGGENLGGGPVTISWAALDPDGDSLSYLVQYTADDGLSWTTLAVDWKATQLTVEGGMLPAGTEGRIRVIVSDGFQSSLDQSDGLFTVQNHAPTVVIHTPMAGEAFVAEQQIVLEADAADLEDGTLDEAGVRWHSSLDGVLGTGALLLREARSLSEGTHVITVTATDSGGLTNATMVTVMVSREELPGLNVGLLGGGNPQVLLSWPASATNFHLQATMSLPATWNNVTNATAVVGDKLQVQLPAAGASKFYRLKNP